MAKAAKGITAVAITNMKRPKKGRAARLYDGHGLFFFRGVHKDVWKLRYKDSAGKEKWRTLGEPRKRRFSPDLATIMSKSATLPKSRKACQPVNTILLNLRMAKRQVYSAIAGLSLPLTVFFYVFPSMFLVDQKPQKMGKPSAHLHTGQADRIKRRISAR